MYINGSLNFGAVYKSDVTAMVILKWEIGIRWHNIQNKFHENM
jgi:hypothetical protein